MDFIWAEDLKINDRLIFNLTLKSDCDELRVCAVDSYQVFLDGKFVFYGPNRTASGYIRPASICVKGAKKVEIKVLSVGTPCYSFDFQKPFFGAVLVRDGKLIYSAKDFDCYRESFRLTDMPRYSRQRGFAEGYDFNVVEIEKVQTTSVCAPKLLDVGASRAEYKSLDFNLIEKKIFNGFNEIKTPWWTKNPAFKAKPTDFDLIRDFISNAIGKYEATDYCLSVEHTGFITVTAQASEPTEIALVFDEYLPDGKWTFARGACNDYIYLKIPAGGTEFISCEPYTLKYLKVIVSGSVDLKLGFTTYENDFKPSVTVSGDAEIEKVFGAAENTFRQNAVDLFTDCPGRERAGWLCDSFFTAKAEQLFTGKNDIERDFITNFLIAKTPEIPNEMLPMCFPSEHDANTYIPNWAMWFMIELCDFYKRTNDIEFVEKAKDRVYGIIEFFNGFTNEQGLLEDLKGWVFLEWSVCNKPEYVKGVNFPSNMTFAYALEKVGELYGDLSLTERAKAIKQRVLELSFDGQFFADNAVRIDGVLTRCDDHVSETCQYYALFTGLCPSKEYERKILNEFGPFRGDNYPNIGKSNAFIGNYLRLFWLCEIGEYDRTLDESVEYFSLMADKTGTLWEHDSPVASCCHGFASAVAVIILKCICGYAGVERGKPLFDDEFPISKKYNLKINFNYK